MLVMTTATAGRVERDTKTIIINNNVVAKAKQDAGNDNCNSRQGRERHKDNHY